MIDMTTMPRVWELFLESMQVTPAEAQALWCGLGKSAHPKVRALARAALGREFPISTLSIMERVPSPTIAHVSSRPP